MPGRRCVWILLLLLASYCADVPIALPQNLTDAWVEKTASPLVEKRIVDGLSIGYLEGAHYGIVHLGSAGRDGKKADNLTIYEIGSVTKVFTALLLADSVVRGEIKLKAAAEVKNPAGLRLPSRDGRSITWLDLSNHRAGLPRLPENIQPKDLANPYREYDSKLAAAFLKTYVLPRSPGEVQEYSNFGTSILGYLVAQKAGKSYQQLLRQRIAEPLKMTDCTVPLSADQKKRLATPHSAVGAATAPWTFADLPGAGGIHASMRDMMRFAKAQLKPPSDQLGAAIELAWKLHSEADASGPAMGLGWMIGDDGQLRWHNGQTGGSTSAVYIDRQVPCAVVILCNTSVANHIDELAMQLVQQAGGKNIKPTPGQPDADDSAKTDAKTATNIPVDADLRRRLEGRYQLTPNFIFTVTDRDGHLMVDITNQPTQEVYPDSPTRWSYKGVAATLEFQLTKSGRAKSLILHQNGTKQTARRID